ncbi:MAG: agmatine deiminase family protein [Mangrovibacterium sp.]
MTKERNFFPAEWDLQSGIQLAWPDEETDWGPALDEVLPVFEQVASEILRREKLLVVCRSRRRLPPFLRQDLPGLQVRELPLNDTWARDYGALTVMEAGRPVLLNFCFNGWGMKFAACHDNQINDRLFRAGAYRRGVSMRQLSWFIFEGGAVESNGEGCLLTTSRCLLSRNRNEHLGKQEIDALLRKTFFADKLIWLDHGFLEGDDTDSHIDTLARFCSPRTIAYVRCTNQDDVHYEELQLMENQLCQAVNQYGASFELVPLPFPDPVYASDGHRLPATYANFLILNQVVLLPVYGVRQDAEAREILSRLFTDREIVCINSVPLIAQHGSVHCISMQFPGGVL